MDDALYSLPGEYCLSCGSSASLCETCDCCVDCCDCIDIECSCSLCIERREWNALRGECPVEMFRLHTAWWVAPLAHIYAYCSLLLPLRWDERAYTYISELIKRYGYSVMRGR